VNIKYNESYINFHTQLKVLTSCYRWCCFQHDQYARVGRYTCTVPTT